jgi:glycosyltransferase involved in cell wall biosynthesis
MKPDTLRLEDNSDLHHDVGIVVIGRNEGERLINCLRSLGPYAKRAIYVDSASSDGSAQAAEHLCAKVLPLDLSTPFTAARARNAGFEALMQLWPQTTFVQFVDGDCELDSDWIDTAVAFLSTHEDVALVFGRRRERYPERTVFNAMCDREWDILAKASVMKEFGGYSGHLIAGEEPELCVRLRERRWKIWRLPSEMTRHDANMNRMSQWWLRSVRCGHAYAQVSYLHRKSPVRIWARNVRRAVFWAGVLPLATALGTLLHPAAIGLLLAYPLQSLRMAQRMAPSTSNRWSYATFDVLGKFAELQGIVQFHMNRLSNRQQRIIEYK